MSPALKAMKFEKYIDEEPRGGEGTEHLLKIPEGAVREVFGGPGLVSVSVALVLGVLTSDGRISVN